MHHRSSVMWGQQVIMWLSRSYHCMFYLSDLENFWFHLENVKNKTFAKLCKTHFTFYFGSYSHQIDI